MNQRKDGRFVETLTIDGHRKFFYGHTKKEVLTKIREYKAEAGRAPTLSVIADKWYDHHIRGLRYKTIESYQRPLAEIRERFGKTPVNEITSPAIASFIREYERVGYARRTIQLRLDILRMIFSYAVGELGILSVNPAEEVKLAKGLPQSRRELASRDDIARIIEHRMDDRFSLLPFLLMYTGLRVCEALALTHEDFGDDGIYIERQLSWEPNAPVLAPVKTAKGERVVPILDVLRDALPEWEGYLFSMDGDGKSPLTKSAFIKRWKNYAKRTGVTCDRHTLRHEFATLLFDADINSKDAAEIMGHDEQVMLNIYTHIRDTRKRLTTKKINEYVNSLSKTL